MNRITEITKRDILDLFQNGLEIDEFFQTRTVTYNYYGRLEEIDFLKRLYDLERMPSFDSRFANAEQDIWQHTVNNDDYPYCWVFEDKRFNLQDGSDEVYLKFLCEVFHPAVRYDKGYWKPIRKRFDDETIVELLRLKWWDWSEEKIAQNIQAIKSGQVEQLRY